MADKKTARWRNGKNGWASAEVIHTFWVGQRVARSSERKNFIDIVAEEGVVVAIPEKQNGDLTVRTDAGEARWSLTEAIPFRVLVDRQRKRFADRARMYSKHLRELDENGMRTPE